MISYDFTLAADSMLRQLPVAVQRRVVSKIDWYIATDDPLHFADVIEGSSAKTYRFRIGEYRIVFDWLLRNGGHLRVIWVGLRGRAYRT